MAEESVDDRKKHRKELEEYFKTTPPPPAELKMERKLKRMIRKRNSNEEKSRARNIRSLFCSKAILGNLARCFIPSCLIIIKPFALTFPG